MTAYRPVVDPCVCTHGLEAHLHLRRGTDCAFCECLHFVRPAPASGLVRRALAAIGRRA